NTIMVQTDANGDGHHDQTRTTVKHLDGSVVAITVNLNPDGSVRDQAIVTTSANGLSTVLQTTLDGIFTSDVSDVTALNADGSRTETVRRLVGAAAHETLVGTTVTTTSADGLSKRTEIDPDGTGLIYVTTDRVVLNADGGRTETLTDFNCDQSLKDQTIT